MSERQWQQADTPFMAFWAAINEDLRPSGLELLYGDARRLWEATLNSVVLRAEPIRKGSAARYPARPAPRQEQGEFVT